MSKALHFIHWNWYYISYIGIGITFHTLELVHLIGGFTVSKGGDGIGQVGVKANE